MYHFSKKNKKLRGVTLKKIMVVFGTRPEAIKMCPLVNELKSRDNTKVVVCVTGQHREMLTSVLKSFSVKPDYNLEIMQHNQSLFDITTNILNNIEKVLINEKPDIVLVHGDTSTTFTTALACYYLRIPVGHVEGGLRTYNLDNPFPEEFNRQAVGIVAKYHFAPTEQAKANLISEQKDPTAIYVTGNTAIDALKTTVKNDYFHTDLEWASDSRLILVTAHRRENQGEPMKNMFKAINKIVKEYPDVKVIYPIHMNKNIQKLANDFFGGESRIRIIPPLEVLDFHNFMNKSYMILTDSGGIQEEAPSLGVPVLVMRETTERPEGLKAGTIKLVGTNTHNIYSESKVLLDDPDKYREMSKANNPYGDGTASKRIADILCK